MDSTYLRLQKLDDQILKLQQQLALLKVHMKRIYGNHIDPDFSETSSANESDDECDNLPNSPSTG